MNRQSPCGRTARRAAKAKALSVTVCPLPRYPAASSGGNPASIMLPCCPMKKGQTKKDASAKHAARLRKRTEALAAKMRREKAKADSKAARERQRAETRALREKKKAELRFARTLAKEDALVKRNEKKAKALAVLEKKRAEANYAKAVK